MTPSGCATVAVATSLLAEKSVEVFYKANFHPIHRYNRQSIKSINKLELVR